MSAKKIINIGHTNKIKYKDGNTFVIKKTNTGFNHNLDYSLLKEFDFVPKLIKETNEEIVWEWIEGTMLEVPTDNDLKQVAKILRTLHKSEIHLPKNNFRKRSSYYIKEGHALGRKWPEIESNWKEMQRLMTKMRKKNPCHNDVWYQNLIKDENGKIWLVDWEYATMGDKHFDLAFYIDSSRLNERQKEIFLKEYDSFDNYNSYVKKYLPDWYRYVNWLTLCWAYAQKEKPFSLKLIKSALKK